jgi:hypothetical protein
MATLATVMLDNTEGPAFTNQLVIVPLSGVSFPFASLQTNGRNLDVLDADGVTSLAHSLRDWGQATGLRLAALYPIPASGGGHPYTFASAFVVGNLGLANDPQWLRGCGGPLNDPNPVYGQWDLFDSTGAHVWTFTSASQDYPMSAEIGDLSGTGTDLVCAVGTRAIDHTGYLLNKNGTARWSYNLGTVGSAGNYVRIANIGKLRSDIAGNQVLWGGANGVLALCDKLGNQLWRNVYTGTGTNFSLQAAIIDDLVGSGTNHIYMAQSQMIRKIDGSGATLWTFTQQLTPVENFYTIASGHVTSLTTKQLAISSADVIGTSNLGVVVLLDSGGAKIWERVIPYPSYAVACLDVNGDGFDEVIVSWGTSTGYLSGVGWGGVLVLDRNGNEIAAGSLGSACKFCRAADYNNSGKPSILISCDDGNFYAYTYEATGGSVKVTVPSIGPGVTRTLSLASSANTTLIPTLGDFDFNLSGSNGSAPPGMTQFLGSWTVQSSTIQSPNDGNTATFTSIEAAGVSTDAGEFEFDAVKNLQADGSNQYFMGCRYRCTNFSSGLPKGFLFLCNHTGGTCQLLETASGTSTATQILFNSPVGLTFNTTDRVRFRVVWSGLSHSAFYSKNSGPWTQLYRLEDASGTPNTGAGTVALYNHRGQTQYSNLVLRTMPSAFSVSGPGPAPKITVTASPVIPSATSAYSLLESGSRALLESGSGLMTEGIAVSTTSFLSLESGFDLLAEDGSHVLLEISVPVIVPSITLREAVYSRLASSTAIAALVSSRIYFAALPQTINLKDGPALTYAVISRPYGHVLTGADGTSQARVQITAHGYREAVVDQIIQAVRDSFDGFVGSIGGLAVTACILDNEVDLPSPPFAGTDQWSYAIAADYQINHRVSLPNALS